MGLYSLCLGYKIKNKYSSNTQVVNPLTYRHISWSLYISLSISSSGSKQKNHVSPQFHVVFDDEFSTVPFMREGKIPPNWTDLAQCSSQSREPDNIDLKYTWFTIYLEEYPIKLQFMS